VLGFQEVSGKDEVLRLRAGRSELIFRAGPLGAPCYHFAFTISSNKAAQARQWLLARGLRLLKDADGDYFQSEEWNAHQMYFLDTDGNIVEFIARHDLPDHSDGPFGAADVLGISEIGIVVPDVLEFVEECTRASGLMPYVDPPHPRFTALGDEHGLLICVPEGRPWYPENRLPATARPAVIRMSAARARELFKPPYCFHFLATERT
jgi:catechol-2,3-dioxygenase